MLTVFPHLSFCHSEVEHETCCTAMTQEQGKKAELFSHVGQGWEGICSMRQQLAEQGSLPDAAGYNLEEMAAALPLSSTPYFLLHWLTQPGSLVAVSLLWILSSSCGVLSVAHQMTPKHNWKLNDGDLFFPYTVISTMQNSHKIRSQTSTISML